MEKIKTENPIVVLITGPMGAGKSSTAKALAEKLEKSAYIKVDHVRKMVIGSYVNPGEENFEVQEDLGTKNTCALANNFLNSGFSVIIDDIVGKEKLKKFAEYLNGKTKKVFLLLPSVDVMIERFHGRGGATEELEKRTRHLHDKFTERQNELYWTVIDSSNLTIEQTVDQILSKIN